MTIMNIQLLAELTVDEPLYGETINVQAADNALKDAAFEISRTFKIPCDTLIPSSRDSANDSVIDSTHFDLIVMGAEGPESIPEMIRGCKSYQVARKVPIPVLLIPPGCGYSGIRKIAYAFDYWHCGSVPLKQAIRFSSAFRLGLTVLQVIRKHSREAEKEMEVNAWKLWDEHKDQVSIEFKTIYDSDPEEALRSYFDTTQTDVMIVHSSNHSLWENLFTRRLIRSITHHLSYPLLIVHE